MRPQLSGCGRVLEPDRLGPEPMPPSLLARNPDTLPAPVAGHLREPGALAERVETLRRRRLARVGPDSVQLHRFPAGLLLTRTAGERTDGDGWATSAVRLLRAGLPATASHNPVTWPAWRPLLPLVLAATDPARPLDPVAADVGWLLSQAAGYLRARGQPRVAQALDEDAHALYLRHFGEGHPDTRAAADRLAADLTDLAQGGPDSHIFTDGRAGWCPADPIGVLARR